MRDFRDVSEGIRVVSSEAYRGVPGGYQEISGAFQGGPRVFRRCHDISEAFQGVSGLSQGVSEYQRGSRWPLECFKISQGVQGKFKMILGVFQRVTGGNRGPLGCCNGSQGHFRGYQQISGKFEEDRMRSQGRFKGSHGASSFIMQGSFKDSRGLRELL